MINWFNDNKRLIIRLAFLVPILSVAIISISHVVSWYDLANPISWAVYLSIAVEIAAMSAIAASSVKVKGFSVWFVFIIVTLIQFIGNIFFSYSEINVNSKEFKDWAELTLPLFDGMGFDTEDIVSQRRFLAVLEGGLLPLISLTCLHFFIKYGDLDDEQIGEPTAIDSPEQTETEEEQVIEDNIDKPTPDEISEIVVQNDEPSVEVENQQEPKIKPAPKKEIPTNKLNSKARRRMRFS